MFLPENIDLAHSEKYNLSIRLAPNGFSFCIHCPKDASVFHFQETSLGNKLSHTENVKKMVFDLGFMSQQFQETMITIVSSYFTPVPNAYFEKKHAKALFDANFYDVGGIVLSEKLDKNDCHVVFSMDEILHSFLSRHLFCPKFQHQIMPLLDFFEQYDRDVKRNRCFVDFHDSVISIICFSATNKLLSTNSFPASNTQDIAYFVASVWEKWSFDQTEDRLYFSGNTEFHQLDILKKLIKNVEVTELKSKVLLDEKVKKTIPTDILTLICE